MKDAAIKDGKSVRVNLTRIPTSKFSCHCCNCSYTSKTYLERHLCKKHGYTKESIPDWLKYLPHTQACRGCNKRYARITSLVAHEIKCKKFHQTKEIVTRRNTRTTASATKGAIASTSSVNESPLAEEPMSEDIHCLDLLSVFPSCDDFNDFFSRSDNRVLLDLLPTDQLGEVLDKLGDQTFDSEYKAPSEKEEFAMSIVVSVIEDVLIQSENIVRTVLEEVVDAMF